MDEPVVNPAHVKLEEFCHRQQAPDWRKEFLLFADQYSLQENEWGALMLFAGDLTMKRQTKTWNIELDQRTYREQAEEAIAKYQALSDNEKPLQILVPAKGMGSAFADYLKNKGLPAEAVG